MARGQVLGPRRHRGSSTEWTVPYGGKVVDVHISRYSGASVFMFV
jgi:hypothetical protein